MQRVTFGQAKRLKAAGFDWRQPEVYKPDGKLEDRDDWADMRHDCYAPTVALALKWTRDMAKGIFGWVGHIPYRKTWHYYWGIEEVLCDFDTYEQAESALLDTVLDGLERVHKYRESIRKVVAE